MDEEEGRRKYTVTRKKNQRLKKDEKWAGVRSISVGGFDLSLQRDVHVYRGVSEEVALRAQKSGEFEIKLEE